MDPFTIATLAGAGLVAAGTRWFVQRFADFGTIRRRLRETKTTPMEKARDGKVTKVEGIVEAVGEPLTAPIGAAPCVAYRVRIFSLEPEHARLFYDDERHVPFRLVGEDGRARVDGPIRFADATRKVLAHDGGPLPEELDRIFDRTYGPVQAAMVVEQALLEVGASGAALGRAQRVLDPSQAGVGYRGTASELRLAELRDGPVIVGSDLDGAT